MFKKSEIIKHTMFLLQQVKLYNCNCSEGRIVNEADYFKQLVNVKSTITMYLKLESSSRII